MKYIDLNCDMGEGVGNDDAIMPFISSANIACGYHAGNEDTMKRTIEACLNYGIAIGAHPSYSDKENFGRKEILCSTNEIYDLVKVQIYLLKKIADECGILLHHVKPHGALYNVAAKNQQIANAIAKAVKDFDENIVLYGLSESISIKEAKEIGLKTANEVFADRTYQDDGSLTSRSQPNALIEHEKQSIQQVLQMIEQGTVTAISGKQIPIIAQTICIHGDGKNAVDFAKKIHFTLQQNNIVIKTI